ncbi:MAG TPA: BolA family protein [Thiobacillaceae bacterium]|nr:BolA family protein [Thiobacillaceae bacterium]HNU62998.1 BolA family protein [Thiobacillaceae bacterium]
MSDIVAEMQARLASLSPAYLDIVDESALHAGHEGARSGGGHYRMTIIAEAFAGQSGVARHRLVYQSLGDLMPTRIHALSVTALTPEEL